MPDNELKRTSRHRGCAVLAMNGVLGGAEGTSCQAAQQVR